MGFRSTFTTVDYGAIEWPEWFKEKYKENVSFNESGRGAIHSKSECKTYGIWIDLHVDIQKAINWEQFTLKFVLVYLHECGGITRCQISKDSIKWSEPDSWRSEEYITHHYCYGCSDV